MIVHRTGRNAPGLPFRHVHEGSHIHRLLGRDSSGLLPPQNDITLEMRLSKAKPFSMTAMSSRTNVRDFMPYILFAGDSSFHVVPFRMTSLTREAARMSFRVRPVGRRGISYSLFGILHSAYAAFRMTLHQKNVIVARRYFEVALHLSF